MKHRNVNVIRCCFVTTDVIFRSDKRHLQSTSRSQHTIIVTRARKRGRKCIRIESMLSTIQNAFAANFFGFGFGLSRCRCLYIDFVHEPATKRQSVMQPNINILNRNDSFEILKLGTEK